MSTVLITGSSRGLGLELVKQSAARASQNRGLVVAAARKCNPELETVIEESNGTVVFVSLDLSDEAVIEVSADEVRSILHERALDIIINCAGVHGETEGKLEFMSDLDYQLSINVTGTHNVLRNLLPLMKMSKVKKVLNISSVYGSMTNARHVAYASCPAYKISKAALNALTVQYALSYEDEGFKFMAVNPGWLQTEMGGKEADLTVSEGASAVLKVLEFADSTSNGTFKNIHVEGWKAYDGRDIPW